MASLLLGWQQVCANIQSTCTFSFLSVYMDFLPNMDGGIQIGMLHIIVSPTCMEFPYMHCLFINRLPAELN